VYISIFFQYILITVFLKNILRLGFMSNDLILQRMGMKFGVIFRVYLPEFNDKWIHTLDVIQMVEIADILIFLKLMIIIKKKFSVIFYRVMNIIMNIKY